MGTSYRSVQELTVKREESGPRGPHGVDKATGAHGTGGEGST